MPADPEAELAEVRLAEVRQAEVQLAEHAERLAADGGGGAAGLGGAGCRPPTARWGGAAAPPVLEQARRSVGPPGTRSARSCGPSCARTSTSSARRRSRSCAGPCASRPRSWPTLGVPPVVRDEVAEQVMPDDVYDLAPGAWADVDDALAEPGLTWGAAKAYVVLARRRGGSPMSAPEVGRTRWSPSSPT